MRAFLGSVGVLERFRRGAQRREGRFKLVRGTRDELAPQGFHLLDFRDVVQGNERAGAARRVRENRAGERESLAFRKLDFAMYGLFFGESFVDCLNQIYVAEEVGDFRFFRLRREFEKFGGGFVHSQNSPVVGADEDRAVHVGEDFVELAVALVQRIYPSAELFGHRAHRIGENPDFLNIAARHRHVFVARRQKFCRPRKLAYRAADSAGYD